MLIHCIIVLLIFLINLTAGDDNISSGKVAVGVNYGGNDNIDIKLLQQEANIYNNLIEQYDMLLEVIKEKK